MKRGQYDYPVVKIAARKALRCTHCPTRVPRRKVFEQTINPWNRDEAGQVKTEAQILEELRAEARAWRTSPDLCTEHRLIEVTA